MQSQQIEILFRIFTTKVAHNGHGHFLVKKSVESHSLVEWRTDVHCSVHVVRLTIDYSSLSICHLEPTSKLDPLKAAVNGPSLVQGGDLGAMTAGPINIQVLLK